MTLCPECETKAHLSTMDMTPELVQEMAEQEALPDFAGDEVVEQRLAICEACPRLIGGMTCADCGCFVHFRVRHKTAACVNGKW